MKKAIALEIIIVVVTLAIVLLLMLSINGTSVTRYNQAINQNDSRSITFDLKRGQTVTGWLDFTGNTNGAWFQIYDPNENLPKIGDITYDGNHVSFTFTADVDGQYYIRVAVLDFSTQYINYQYSISAPPIMGIDRTVLTGIMITIGVVLALTIAVWDLRRSRIKKEELNFNPTNQPTN